MAKAYVANGIHCIEVTFDQASAEKRLETAKSIRAIKETLGDQVSVGAGTVMTVEQVQMAAEAGAEYMISPNVDEEVIKETKRLGKLSIPGAMTPSEVAAAYKMGADIVKLFPANEVGLSYIKAIKAPLSHIPLMAPGGVRPSNAAESLKAGSAAIGVGGQLVLSKAVKSGDDAAIEARAREFTDAIKAWEAAK